MDFKGTSVSVQKVRCLVRYSSIRMLKGCHSAAWSVCRLRIQESRLSSASEMGATSVVRGLRGCHPARAQELCEQGGGFVLSFPFPFFPRP